MLTILLVVQIILSVAMVFIILIQRSSSDGLSGLSGGSSGGNSLISGRSSANILTKTTAILATAFIVNSLTMATITARNSSSVDKLFIDEQNAAQQNPDAVELNSTNNVEDSEPSVPIAE